MLGSPLDEKKLPATIIATYRRILNTCQRLDPMPLLTGLERITAATSLSLLARFIGINCFILSPVKYFFAIAVSLIPGATTLSENPPCNPSIHHKSSFSKNSAMAFPVIRSGPFAENRNW